MSLFATKSLERIKAESEGGEHHLKKTLGPVNLVALGIGAIIGAGLFSLTGIAAADNAGPAVVLSFVVAAIGCAFAAGFAYVNPANYTPFMPENTGKFGEFGFSGVMRAAAVIFFAYIGFDAVSTAAQEAKKPQRDMPIGIIGSLVVCTILYILFARVLTGMIPYRKFHGDAAPVETVISLFPYAWLQITIVVGIIAGYTSVILVMLLGQSRVFYSMSRDGLLPKVFSDIHP